MSAPLAGVRVLDLSRLLPGPMCSLYLADLGADVIKVEDTRAGDYARALDTPPGRVSAMFRAINRGKRSVAIDLKDARGRDAFLALVRTADVVLEGFRPGVMAALGLDHPALAAVRPALVYCSISGYGQDGPRANEPGHDINYLGYTGVLEASGARGGPPALSSLQIADLLGGAASAAIAILAALVAARGGGEGRRIDVAMADATLAHAVFGVHAMEQRGAPAARGDDLLTGGVPCYGVYATGDARFLAVGALEEKFWTTLCQALGRADLVARQFERGAAVRGELEAIFAGATLAQWTDRLARSIAASPRCAISRRPSPIRSSRRVRWSTAAPTARPSWHRPTGFRRTTSCPIAQRPHRGSTRARCCRRRATAQPRSTPSRRQA